MDSKDTLSDRGAGEEGGSVEGGGDEESVFDEEGLLFGDSEFVLVKM